VFLTEDQRNPLAVDTKQSLSPKKFNLTEDTINEYIRNLSISAISLDVGAAQMPVHDYKYKTVYHFSNPLSIILPYSLWLSFATISIGIGIWSLVQNGTSAADGGFPQVITAITGRTKMEDRTLAQHFDQDKLPKELLYLKIRYGELFNVDGIGTSIAGFRTVDETKLLRNGYVKVLPLECSTKRI
jgi:hypothetical protein